MNNPKINILTYCTFSYECDRYSGDGVTTSRSHNRTLYGGGRVRFKKQSALKEEEDILSDAVTRPPCLHKYRYTPEEKLKRRQAHG
jgi:hypothetical protein